jgi:uncharacterized protein (DUF169 family)
MQMFWQDWSQELKAVLELKGSPVALAYASEPAPHPTREGRLWVCRALKAAREGEVINLTAETSGCPGGSSYLGLRELPREHLDTVADFLIHGEKLMASLDVFYRARSHGAPPPAGLAKVVVICPLEKAEVAPQLVIFFCTPLQASRLVTLVNFEVGEPIDVRLSGSTCSTTITTPLYTGKVNLSLVDTTSRHICHYDPQELLVTVPMHLMHGVMRSLDRCSAGRAPIEWPERMATLMKGD